MKRRKKRVRRFRQRMIAFLGLIGICLLMIMAGRYIWYSQLKKAAVEEAIIKNTLLAQKDYVAVVDAGHGGKDQGCAKDGILEKDINLDIAQRLQEALTQAGVTVVMTREEDQTLSLDERVKIAESSDADIFISIHTDSYEKNPNIKGMTVHYQKNAVMGKELAYCLQESLKSVDFASIRDVHESNWYVTRNTSMAAVLFECGYITNKQELKSLMDENYRQQMVECLANAMIKYMNEQDA